MNADRENTLESFEGFVDKFDGDIAHITLKAESGEIFHAECSAAEFKEKGIHERRRFRCRTVEVENDIKFVVEPIPDRVLTEDYEKQLDEWLKSSLGEGECDDY